MLLVLGGLASVLAEDQLWSVLRGQSYIEIDVVEGATYQDGVESKYLSIKRNVENLVSLGLSLNCCAYKIDHVQPPLF